MTDALPTSERLRQTQQALAASQADLTRAEAELARVTAERDEARTDFRIARTALVDVGAERDQFRSNYLRDAARVDQLDGDLVDMELDLADVRAPVVQVQQERDWAREVVGMLRRNEEIRAQVIRERNTERNRLTDDLRSAELERDGVREELARQAETNEDLTGTLAMRTSQLTASRRHVNAAIEAEAVALERAGRYRRERDLARAELATVTAELEQLRAQLPTPLHTEEPHA